MIRLKFRVKALILAFLSALTALCLAGCAEQGKTDSVNCAGEKIVLPVLMYHGLTADSGRQNRYMIPPSLFESDLQYLSKAGYTSVSVSELVSHFENGTALPDKPVLITFDDGYLNNYTYGYPLLKKYGMKALISPIAKTADDAENEKYRSPEWSQCRWSELEEMVKSGLVELGNHTYDLHHLTTGKRGVTKWRDETEEAYQKRISADITAAQDRIGEKTGKKPAAFVYPYGAKSSGTESVIRELGFRVIFDCESRLNAIGSAEDLYHLHRFIRPDDKTTQEFFTELGINQAQSSAEPGFT